MLIPFTCPHCGVKTDVAEEYAGQSGPCASCGQTITIPALAGTPRDYQPPKASRTPIVVIALLLVAAVGGLVICGGGALFWAVRSRAMFRPPSPAPTCYYNLQRIGLALHSYHDVYRCFPPAYVADQDGQPMHSWRVLILPFLDAQPQYQQYNFDEPWNSPGNLVLLDMMPDVYSCPEDWQGDPANTSYVMIVGPDTISDGPTARKITDITDGTAYTIMVVEVANSGIGWIEPSDLKAEDVTFAINDGSAAGIRSEHFEGANVLFGDGSVRMLPDGTDPAWVKAATTVAGGEDVSQGF
jgi:prepilin-type processing-associated H-X9-DG protein